MGVNDEIRHIPSVLYNRHDAFGVYREFNWCRVYGVSSNQYYIAGKQMTNHLTPELLAKIAEALAIAATKYLNDGRASHNSRKLGLLQAQAAYSVVIDALSQDNADTGVE